MKEVHNNNINLNDSESFFQEDVKKENRFIKKFILNLFLIFTCFSLGIALSFSATIFKDMIIPKFANDSIQNFKQNEDLQIENVSNSISYIIENVKPAIVSITTLTQMQDFFNNNIDRENNGSGIIFHKTATEIYIVTDYNIISNAKDIGVAIEDNKPISAKIVAKNPNENLAIISVPIEELNKMGIYNIKVAKFADSSNVLEGDYVIAIGNAIGEGNIATFGIISATSREVVIQNRRLNVLQTTAAINPGNSGGALINLKGEVIGINIDKITDFGVEGIGYSISSNIAMPLIEEMLNNTNPATLGVEIIDASSYPDSKYKAGALVLNVLENSSAHRAGILPYDIITSINGVPILNSSQLIKEVKKHSPKDIAKLTLIRENEVISVKVKFLQPKD